MAKDDPRVEAMGTVDELNAVIGMVVSVIRHKQVRSILLKVQDDLFTVGAELAQTKRVARRVPTITSAHVARLEAAMEALPVVPIRKFILPRGSEALVRLHWARAVARRAERRIVALSKRAPVNSDLLQYANRLSSLLYHLTVWLHVKERTKEEHPTYRA